MKGKRLFLNQSSLQDAHSWEWLRDNHDPLTKIFGCR